jgi:hypothetical protein
VFKRLRLRQPRTRGRVVEVAVGGWLGRRMQRADWGAVTVPFPFVTLIAYWQGSDDGSPPAPSLRVHEFHHVAQNDRDAFWAASWARYVFGLARALCWRCFIRRPYLALLAAYADHPAEVEAYAVEAQAIRDGLPTWVTEETE